MERIKSIINLILVIVIFLIMHHYLTPSNDEVDCMHYNDFIDLNLDGIITNKYYDKSQHSYPTIELKSLKDNDIQKIYLVGEKTDLFNLLCISDTILKKKYSDIVSKKRNGVFFKVTKVDFGCKQVAHPDSLKSP